MAMVEIRARVVLPGLEVYYLAIEGCDALVSLKDDVCTELKALGAICISEEEGLYQVSANLLRAHSGYEDYSAALNSAG